MAAVEGARERETEAGEDGRVRSQRALFRILDFTLRVLEAF